MGARAGVAALASLAAALVGCGLPVGSGTSTEGEAREFLGRVFTEVAGPEKCDEMTQRMIEDFWDGDGEEAIEACREDNPSARGASATSISINSLQVDGNKATALVVVTEGRDAGTSLTMELAREGGEWKIDRYVSMEFDRRTIDRQMIAQASDNGLTTEEARCQVRRLHRAFSDRELGDMFLGGEEEMTPLLNVTMLCLSPTHVRAEFTETLMTQMSGRPPRVLRCALRVLDEQGTNELRALLATAHTGVDPTRVSDFCARLGAACASAAATGSAS